MRCMPVAMTTIILIKNLGSFGSSRSGLRMAQESVIHDPPDIDHPERRCPRESILQSMSAHDEKLRLEAAVRTLSCPHETGETTVASPT